MTIGELIDNLSKYLDDPGTTLNDDIVVRLPDLSSTIHTTGAHNVPGGIRITFDVEEIERLVDRSKAGKMIHRLRHALHQTTKEVSALTGVSFTTIRLYERGQYVPTLSTLCSMARGYGLTIEQFLSGDHGHAIDELAPKYLGCVRENPHDHVDGTDFRALRLALSYSIKDFAALIGIGLSTAKKYEHHHSDVSKATVAKIAHTLGITEEQIINRDFSDVVKRHGKKDLTRQMATYKSMEIRKLVEEGYDVSGLTTNEDEFDEPQDQDIEDTVIEPEESKPEIPEPKEKAPKPVTVPKPQTADKSVGRTILALRDMLSLTRSSFAAKFNINQKKLKNYERCQIPIPMVTIEKIAAVLRISEEAIIDGSVLKMEPGKLKRNMQRRVNVQ